MNADNENSKHIEPEAINQNEICINRLFLELKAVHCIYYNNMWRLVERKRSNLSARAILFTYKLIVLIGLCEEEKAFIQFMWFPSGVQNYQ